MSSEDDIVDRMRDKCGRRPDSARTRIKPLSIFIGKTIRPTFIWILQESVFLCVDTANSSASAHAGNFSGGCHHGHRLERRKRNFINPMCGSGTLAIEAAYIVLNRAARSDAEQLRFYVHQRIP